MDSPFARCAVTKMFKIREYPTLAGVLTDEHVSLIDAFFAFMDKYKEVIPNIDPHEALPVVDEQMIKLRDYFMRLGMTEYINKCNDILDFIDKTKIKQMTEQCGQLALN